jgi:hypothetical protein
LNSTRGSVDVEARKPLMPANRPLWLRAVLKLERAIGEPIEAAVHSDRYFDLISATTRLRRQAAGLAEGVSRRALHVMNLPAGSDIRKMRQQLARMERRLGQLSDDVSELDEPREHPRKEPRDEPREESRDEPREAPRDGSRAESRKGSRAR